MRLGEEAEGWRLAQEVQTADPYDVVAYNLVTLEETLSKFSNLPSAHFVVRMEPHEAEVYGKRVLDLLERAHAQLGAKYGFDAKQKVSVEIFPDQKDFAIRTFGLPGGAGYLGVCFGNVITANSPAARPGSANNWESILWHEFTHVITLGLTKNRMPRWLSEGISVYEERQARGNWGELVMTASRYRAMILGNDFTPLSQLSGAFLRPKTPMHLQFAYYESSLAVEYLIERFGLPALKAVFADLANNVALNVALAKHAAPLATLDQEFGERARNLATNVGPQLDWEKPDPATMADPEKLKDWEAKHPNSYVALLEAARQLISNQGWAAAKAPLTKLIELYPDQHDAEGAYSELAHVHRALGEKDEELAVNVGQIGVRAFRVVLIRMGNLALATASLDRDEHHCCRRGVLPTWMGLEMARDKRNTPSAEKRTRTQLAVGADQIVDFRGFGAAQFDHLVANSEVAGSLDGG